MELKKIEQGVRLILEGVGEKTDRQGLSSTPARVAEMYEEILGSTGKSLDLGTPLIEKMHGENIISVRDIDFYSICEHHFLPFFGKVNVFYMPAGNRVAGFSKIAKIVDHYARRLQIQERLTDQIADTIMEFLQPKGVLVCAEATQLCVSMRGEHKKNVRTITETIRGEIPFERIAQLKQGS